MSALPTPEGMTPATPSTPAAAPASAPGPRKASLKEQTTLLAKTRTLVVGAMVLGVVLFYGLGYRPAQRRLAALRMQIDLKQRELTTSKDRVADLPLLLGEVGKLDRKVADYERQFPRQLELGQFIKDLTRLCQQVSLKDWKYQPGAPRRNESLHEMPIVMQFNGDFVSAASFLQQVETLQRLTRVKRLKMKQKEAQEGVVEVEASVSIYFSEGN